MRIAARRGFLAVLLLTSTAVRAAGSGDLDPTFNGGAPRLLHLPLATTREKLQASEAATGRQRRIALRKARAAVARFRQFLGSRAAVRAISDAVRARFVAEAGATIALVGAL